MQYAGLAKCPQLPVGVRHCACGMPSDSAARDQLESEHSHFGGNVLPSAVAANAIRESSTLLKGGPYCGTRSSEFRILLRWLVVSSSGWHIAAILASSRHAPSIVGSNIWFCSQAFAICVLCCSRIGSFEPRARQLSGHSPCEGRAWSRSGCSWWNSSVSALPLRYQRTLFLGR